MNLNLKKMLSENNLKDIQLNLVQNLFMGFSSLFFTLNQDVEIAIAPDLAPAMAWRENFNKYFKNHLLLLLTNAITSLSLILSFSLLKT